MTDDQVYTTIADLFRRNDLMRDADDDEDLFDLGISSLTLVSLQIEVEEALGWSLPTSYLMKFSTMRQWATAYIERARELAARTWSNEARA